MKVDPLHIRRIAEAGFPKHIHELIGLPDSKLMAYGPIWRIYHKDARFSKSGIFPETSILTIHIEKEFIQFNCGNKMFNHLEAIKEAVRVGIISKISFLFL